MLSIKQKLLVASLGFVVIIALLGGLTRRESAQMGHLAVGIYDQSFIGLSYVVLAQEEFLHLGDSDPTTSPRATIQPVLDRLDVAIERAATERTRAAVAQVRAQLAALPDATPDELLPRIVQAGRAIAQLVKQFSTDGLQSRDNAEAAQANSAAKVAAEITAALGLALAITLVLGRNLSRPLVHLVGTIEALAAGDTERQVAPALLARRDEIGAVARATTIFREAMRRNARNDEERLSAALASMSQALVMFDAADRLIVANPRLAELFGLPPACLERGTTLEQLFARLHAESNLPADDVVALRHGLTGLKANSRRTSIVHDTSDNRSLAVSFTPVEHQGWLVTLEDISARRQAEARIAHMAHHDALTGLANRVLFQERLRDAVARAHRGDSCAVLCLDLDRFKVINDTLGHPIGDALLRAVTARLAAEIRETDTVARLGGDEFAIIQSSIAQPQDAAQLAARLVEVLGEPYEIERHHLVIGASIGIALAPADGATPDQILMNADLALYTAKAEGRNCYRFFAPEMDQQAQARRHLELDLRAALAEGQFRVFYQPLMNVSTGAVSAFEALLRWQHPTRGNVPPSDFIPLAEEIGLIVPLGGWVLHQACADAITWPDDVKIAVNLSPIQLASPVLVSDVAAILAETGLAPDRLELEITETAMLEDTDATLATLHRLRDLGVDIALDDFGTGYSSLSYLRRFPFDKVKIDRSFVEGMGHGGDNDAIVTAVTSLCETLGMITTAEGVETHEQLRLLRNANCTEVQGYLFSKARPADEVAAICRLRIPINLAATTDRFTAPAT